MSQRAVVLLVFACLAAATLVDAWFAGPVVGAASSPLVLSLVQVVRGGGVPGAVQGMYDGVFGYFGAWPTYLLAGPLFLWRSTTAVTIALGAVRLATYVLEYRLFRRATEAPVALVATLLAACLDPLALMVRTDWFALPAALLAIDQLLIYEERGKTWAIAASGAALVLAVEAQPLALVLVPVIFWVRLRSTRRAGARQVIGFVAAALAAFLPYVAFPYGDGRCVEPHGLELLARSNLIAPALLGAVLVVDPWLVRSRRGQITMGLLCFATLAHLSISASRPEGLRELRLFGLRFPLRDLAWRSSEGRSWGYLALALPLLPACRHAWRSLDSPAGAHRVLRAWGASALLLLVLSILGVRLHYLLLATPPLALVLVLSVSRLAPLTWSLRWAAPMLLLAAIVIGAARLIAAPLVGVEPMQRTRARLKEVQALTHLGVEDLQLRVHGTPERGVSYCSYESSCFLTLGLMTEATSHDDPSLHYYFSERPPPHAASLALPRYSTWLVPYRPALRQERAVLRPNPNSTRLPWRSVQALQLWWSGAWRASLLAELEGDLQALSALAVSLPRDPPSDPRLDHLEVAVTSQFGAGGGCVIEARLDGAPLELIRRDGSTTTRARFRVPAHAAPATVEVAIRACAPIAVDVYDAFRDEPPAP